MPYTLGLSGGYYHDSAACLVKDGHIIAFAEEERFTRVKHNKNSRSCSRAAAFCLAKAGIRLQDIAVIALGWNPFWPQQASTLDDKDLIRELLDPRFFEGYLPQQLTIVEHHLSHAASAFYCSGMREANVLVVDGSGDGYSTTLSYGDSKGLHFVKKYDFTQSLGWFYEFVTEYVGLGDWQNAGKLMGLAPYGQPVYAFDFIQPTAEGYRIDLLKVGLHPASDPIADYLDLSEQGYYVRFKKAYSAHLAQLGILPQAPQWQVNAQWGKVKNRTQFADLQKNIAASAQKTLEECVCAVVEYAITTSGNHNLCIAGGTGLNCSVNGKLQQHPLVDALYVQPAAGDAGTAIGSALEAAYQAEHFTFPLPAMASASLGPSYSNQEIYHVLQQSGLPFTFHTDDLEEVAAHALVDGAVIGWFQGRMEGGPRALGNRSILADPRTTEKRDLVNQYIKQREMWRPLAPSILASHLREYVVGKENADFMIVACQASERAHAQIPATVHVDGSMRPQAVRQDTHSRYARLLEAFATLTCVPALLNTSFNLDSEPIVCTPVDAIRTFCSTPLDILVIENFVVRKNKSTNNDVALHNLP